MVFTLNVETEPSACLVFVLLEEAQTVYQAIFGALS